MSFHDANGFDSGHSGVKKKALVQGVSCVDLLVKLERCPIGTHIPAQNGSGVTTSRAELLRRPTLPVEFLECRNICKAQGVAC